MDLSTIVILSAAALLAINRLIFIGERWWEKRWRFIGIQALNIAGASYMVLWGVPGFTGETKIANYLLAGLIVFHALSNTRRYQRDVQEAREDEREAERERASNLREALNRAESGGDEVDG